MAEQVVGIIPARLASTRFPNKVLADKTGRTLIEHVWQAAGRARTLSRLVVAVDDPKVEVAARLFGAEVVMTSREHPNGTSRLHEASALLRLSPETLVVNIQGDEPDLDASVIDAGVERARLGDAEVATIASPFRAGEDPANPNIVKVVVDRGGRALYFSRALIPHVRDAGGAAGVRFLRHVGLYVYRVGFLSKYVAMTPTPLEQAEMLEQLRVLEHGHRIAVAIREVSSTGIDTPQQYEEFVERWRRTQGQSA